MRDKNHKKCLFCGSENPWSFGLCFKLRSDGWVYSEFQAHQNLQGYDGILHGGIIASLLDSAMTNYLFTQNIEAVTGDLSVRFLHPIGCQSKLIVKAGNMSDNNPLYILNSEIICNDVIMAKAKAKFVTRSVIANLKKLSF